MRKTFDGSTVKDLVARAKANPGKITAATPGIGSVGHLATVQLEMLAGIKTMQVPYRGPEPGRERHHRRPCRPDVRHADDVAAAASGDGKVKIIGTGTPERVREFPEVPTIAETLPGYRAVTWYAMVAPPQMPAALADRINRDVVEILGRKDVAERVRAHPDGAGDPLTHGGGEILRRGGARFGAR